MDARADQQLREELAYHSQRRQMPPGYTSLPEIPTGRYTRQDFHDLEMENIFPHSWMCAGREQEIPTSGSYKVFGKLGPSILIVRGKDNKVRAFYNTCQHRGARVVRAECGRDSLLRCQYHAWTYDLTGKLIAVPDDERDFGGVDKTKHSLVEINCDIWGGWIFVNLDRDARPLREECASIAEEFGGLKMEELRIVQRYSNVVTCNWKAASDAFQEAYHAPVIHKQIGPAIDRFMHTVALFPDGHSRMMQGFNKGGAAQALQGDDAPKIATMPQLLRESSTSYLLFPNVIIAVRASGILFIMFWPRGLGETEIESIAIGPDWGDAERPAYWDEYNKSYKQLLDEDCENLASIQNSMESGALSGLTIGYQERRIYWTHQEVDRRMGLNRVPPDLAVKQILSADPPPIPVAAE